MTATTMKKAIVEPISEALHTSFRFLSNNLVEITLQGSQTYFKGYGKVLEKPHVLGYKRIMLENGNIIFLDTVNKTLVEFNTYSDEEYNFTEIYRSVLCQKN